MKSINKPALTIPTYLYAGIRFGVASIFAVVLLYVLVEGRIFTGLRGLIPDEQLFLKLLFGIIFLLLAFGAMGLVIGVVGGDSLNDLNKRLRGQDTGMKLGLVMALTNAISAFPLLILFLTFGYYNEVFTPIRLGFIFALLGGVYGLIFSILFILFHSRQVKKMRFFLNATGGFLLAGGLAGVLLWAATMAAYRESMQLAEAALVAAALFVFYTIGGIFLSRGAMVSEKENTPIIRPLYSKIALGVLITVVLLITVLNLAKVSTFLIIKDAHLSETLQIDTKFAAWQFDVEPLATRSEPGLPTVMNVECIDGAIFINGEESDYSSCLSTPQYDEEAGGVHIVWISQDVEGTNFTEGTDIIYEATFNGTWSDQMVVYAADEISELKLTYSDGLWLSWVEEGTTSWAFQPVYACDSGNLSRLDKVLYNAITEKNFYTIDSFIPYCGNSYNSIVYLPNPVSRDSKQQISLNGSYDEMAKLTREAKYEVLFTTMEWVADDEGLSPGAVYAAAIADLYNSVKENPEQYPKGMDVKILLGNYPEVNNREWGQQIFNVLEDLHNAGLYTFSDPEIGWNLEVANFDGTWPHGHTKFIVVDGKEVIASGFNYSYLHLAINHPSLKGLGMADMGLHMTGPVAQNAMVVYDDLWDGSSQIDCPHYREELPIYWEYTCDFAPAEVRHIEEVKRFAVTEDDETSFSLFRNKEYKEADHAVAAALGAAEESVDIFHVNFSLEVICDVGIVLKDFCDFDNALPWMESLVESIDEEDVKVRIIVEKSAMNGMENKIGLKAFYDELKRRGVEDNVEIKFYSGKMHAKSTLIDDELLIIGSQNMHYSAWGKSGLTEYSLSTSNDEAIKDYQETFEEYWDEGIPAEELMELE
ncbi:MAG: phospholipase D-like domain-containing protein [Candidatus Dojkabacteria bacterium]|nr:MAG: phospholipase D-like domain-containing protein [Candidatus Dojkabacteria bacterium]